MAKEKFEQQARTSLILGAVAIFMAIAQAGAIFSAFRPAEFEVVMRAGGMRFYAILACTAISAISAVIGAYLGFESVHKRNKNPSLSWAGFFLNTGALTVCLSVFVFFWFTKELFTVGGQ